MAGSARYTAALDACVLYPAPVRDLLLSLAHASMYHARWTDQIQNEWVENLLANRKDLLRADLQRTIDLMTATVPDCLIQRYEPFIAGQALPDPNDRHVLAAAIVGHADAIVTFNLRDFPNEALARYHIEAQHPDDFIMNQFELHELAAIAAVKRMRARLRNPPVSADELINTIERHGLPQAAAHLRSQDVQSLL